MLRTRAAGRRVLLTAAASAALARPAFAQPRFPDRPLRVFVPWTPGGATDLQMRAVCDVASRHLGQPIVVTLPWALASAGATAKVGQRPELGQLS